MARNKIMSVIVRRRHTLISCNHLEQLPIVDAYPPRLDAFQAAGAGVEPCIRLASLMNADEGGATSSEMLRAAGHCDGRVLTKLGRVMTSGENGHDTTSGRRNKTQRPMLAWGIDGAEKIVVAEAEDESSSVTCLARRRDVDELGEGKWGSDSN